MESAPGDSQSQRSVAPATHCPRCTAAQVQAEIIGTEGGAGRAVDEELTAAQPCVTAWLGLPRKWLPTDRRAHLTLELPNDFEYRPYSNKDGSARLVVSDTVPAIKVTLAAGSLPNLRP